MDSFWGTDYEYISVLGRDHLIYVGALLLVLGLLLGRRGWVREHAEGVRRALVGLLLAQQATLYTWYAVMTGFDPAEALPLHICRLAVLAGLGWLLTGRRWLMDVQFFLGLFAYLSFSYPQLIQPVTHVIGWSFFVNHLVTILLPVFAALTTTWRPSLRGLTRGYAVFVLFFVVALVINPLVGGNYYYLRHRPVMAHWPDAVYLPGFLAFTLVLFLLGYVVARLLDPVGPSHTSAASSIAGPYQVSSRPLTSRVGTDRKTSGPSPGPNA